MIELGVLELLGMMLGSGGVTGAATIAGLRVHISYLREASDTHTTRSAEIIARVDSLEREQIRLEHTANRAHTRLDYMEVNNT